MTQPFLKDALGQLEVLLRRKNEISGVINAQTSTQSTSRQSKAASLSFDEVQNSLRLLQKWITYFAKDNLVEICNKLIDLSSFFAVRDTTAKKKKESKSKARPTTHDDPETIEDLQSDSIDFFVMETMHLCLHANVIRDESHSAMRTLPHAIVTFCFEKIDFSYPAAIKHQASLCVGVLSLFHLEKLCDMFLRKLTSIKKKDEFREFVPYQKAMKHFAFGFTEQDRKAVTVNYFVQFSQAIANAKIERGVLRYEVCHSLAKIFSNIIDSKDTARRKEWELFSNSESNDANNFWEAYNSIYKTIMGWASKAKHALFCYELLHTMASLGTFDFYVSKWDELSKKLLEGLKNKKGETESRMACLGFIRDFVNHLPVDFVHRSMDSFSSSLKAIVVLMFPRKQVPTREEQDLLSEVLDAMAAKHIHFIVNVVQEILKSVNYCPEQKAVGLKCLSHMAKNYSPEIETYQFTLGPLLAPYLEENTEPAIVNAALSCFPAICHPNPAKFQETINRIGDLTQSTDREIATTASFSLHEHLLSNPDQNLLPVLEIMARALSRDSLLQDSLMKTFSNITFILNSYLDVRRKRDTGEKSTVDGAGWNSLRVKFEGICLLWFTHSEAWVRTESLRLLTLLADPELQAIEATAPNAVACPYLVDVLANTSAADDSNWDPRLTTLLVEQHDQYRSSVSQCWFKISPIWNTFVKGQSQEKLQQSMNYLKYMCLAIRMPTDDQTEPSLDLTSVTDFFTEVVTLLMQVDSEAIREGIVSSLELLHSSSIPGLIRQVKVVASDRLSKGGSAGKSGGKTGTSVMNPMYYLDQTLELLVRLFSRMNREAFAAAPTVIQDTLGEFVVTWTNEANLRVLLTTTKLRQRVFAARLMAINFDLAGQGRDGNYIAEMFRVLITLMPTPVAGEPTLSNVTRPELKGKYHVGLREVQDLRRQECEVVRAIAALLSICPIQNEAVEESIVGFLMSLVQRGEYIHVDVDYALQTLLMKNPHRLQTFVLGSLPEINDESQISSTEVALFYLHALVRFVETLFESGEPSTIPPAKIVFLSLLHQCSECMMSRQLAIDLANALARSVTSPYDPGYNLPACTHPSSHIYTEAAVRYSSALARKYVDLTAPLLEEVVRVNELLSEINKKSLLRLILPWVQNFGPYIKQQKLSAEETIPASRAILECLFSLTRQCQASPFLMSIIGPLWAEIVSDSEHSSFVVPAVVDFLLHQYMNAMNNSSMDTNDGTLAKMVFVYISRTPSASLILGSLVRVLRTYNEEAPQSCEEFLVWQAKRGRCDEDITPTEQAAFQLLVDLAFEYDTVLTKHLPILLHSAIVLRGMPIIGDTVQKWEGNEMLYNLLHSLGIRHASSSKKREAVIQYLKSYNLNTASAAQRQASGIPIPSSLDNTQDTADVRILDGPTEKGVASSTSTLLHRLTIAGDSGKGESKIPLEGVQELLDIFSTHCPNLESEWSRLALVWAVHARDPYLSLESFRIFSAFDVAVDYDLLLGLSLCLFTAIRDGEDEKIGIITNMFCNMPSSEGAKTLDLKGYTVIISAAVILLHSSSVSHFDGGSRIFEQVFKYAPAERQAELYGVVQGLLTSDEGLDTSISNVLFKGLTLKTTMKNSMLMFENLATNLCGVMEANNHVLLTILMVKSLEICLEDPGSLVKAIEFCNTSGYNLARFTEIFTNLLENKYPRVYAQALLDDRRPSALRLETLTELAQKSDDDSPSFLDEIFQALLVNFGTNENFDYMLRFVLTMLHRGDNRYSLPLLQMLNCLLHHFAHAWTPDQFAEVAEVSVDSYFLPNETIVSSVESTLVFMVGNAPRNVPNEAFNFLRSKHDAPRVRRASDANQAVNTVFRGSSDQDIQEDRWKVLSNLRRHLFNLSSDNPEVMTANPGRAGKLAGVGWQTSDPAAEGQMASLQISGAHEQFEAANRSASIHLLKNPPQYEYSDDEAEYKPDDTDSEEDEA